MKVGFKITSCFVAFVLLVAISANFVFAADYTSESSFMYGDVNMDGNVTVADVALIQRYVSALTTLSADQLVIADVNYSGTVTASDATAIQKYLAGIQDYFVE